MSRFLRGTPVPPPGAQHGGAFVESRRPLRAVGPTTPSEADFGPFRGLHDPLADGEA